MKYVINVVKEIEVDIESEALKKLAADPMNHNCNPLYDDWIDEAIVDVEKATGIPCGRFELKETIDAVYIADTHKALLEW